MKILKFLSIVLVLAFAADVAAEDSKYVTAVRAFADNVIQYGKDVYGPKQTPLFVDGVNVDTHQPPEWKKDGETWILSNMALPLIFPLPIRRQRPNLRQQRHLRPNQTIRGYAEFDRASSLPVIPTGYVFSGHPYSYSRSAIDSDGQNLRDVGFAMKGNLVKFETGKNEFPYVLRKDRQ